MMKKYVAYFLTLASVAIALSIASNQALADTLFVTNSSNNTVAVINGSTTTVFGSSATLSGPTGLAINSLGDLFVANNNSGNIAEFIPSGGGYVFNGNFATGLSNPRGLIFDASGNLYVANQSNGTIDKFTPGGAESLFASGLSTPNAMAFNSSGNLYVTNGTGGAGSGSISVITPGGFVANFPVTGAPLNAPNGIAVESGNLFVVDHNDPAVEEITSGGVGSLLTINAGTLNQPKTLNFDSAGNLYVSDFGSNSVTEYNPTTGALLNTYTSDISGPCFVVAEAASLTVPEPPTYALVGLGVAMVCFFNRRKNAKS